MMYSYFVSSDDLKEELQANGPDHIYNVKKGDVVVVELKISPEESKVSNFVANLSNKWVKNPDL